MRYNNPYLRKSAAAGNLFYGGPKPAIGNQKVDTKSLQQLGTMPTVQQQFANDAAAKKANIRGQIKGLNASYQKLTNADARKANREQYNNLLLQYRDIQGASAQTSNATPAAKPAAPVAAATEKKPVTPVTPATTQNNQQPAPAQQPKQPINKGTGGTPDPSNADNYANGGPYDNADDDQEGAYLKDMRDYTSQQLVKKGQKINDDNTVVDVNGTVVGKYDPYTGQIKSLYEGQPVVNENGKEPESPIVPEETEEDRQRALQEKADQALAEEEQRRNQAIQDIKNKGQTLGEDGETIYDANGTPVGRLNADGTIEEVTTGMNPNSDKMLDPAETKRQDDASNAAKSGKYDTNIAGWYTDFKFEDPSSWIPRVLAGLLGAIVGGTLTDNPLGAVVGGALGWGAGGGVQKNWTQLFGSDAEKQALAAQQQQQEAAALAAAKDFENDPDVQRAKALGLNPQEVYAQKKQRSALYQQYSDAIKAFKGLDPKSPYYEQAKQNLREMQRRLHQLKHSEFADKKYA